MTAAPTFVAPAGWRSRSPGARYVELPGEDHLIWADPDPILDQVEEFVTGVPPAAVPDRVLLTVLFTDVVASTERLAELGDDAWRQLLDRHDDTIRRYLRRYHGREIATTGDGFLAVFDGPARAVRCAQAIADAVVASRPGDPRGRPHWGGRASRRGIGGSPCTSPRGSLRSLAGRRWGRPRRRWRPHVRIRIAVASRGAKELKGVPGRWELYTAT